MRHLLKTEFFKMSRSKILWTMTSIMLVYFIVALIQGSVETTNLISFLSEIIFSISIMLPFYGIILAHEYIAGYFKDAIFAGNTKWQVYFTRYLAFFAGTVIIIFFPVLLITLFFFLKDGATEVFVNCDITLLADVGFLVLYCLCFSAFLMMFTMIEKSYAAVVFLCIIYNAVFVFVHEIIPQNDIPNWIVYSFVGIQDKLFGAKDATECFKIVSALLGQTVVCTGIGYVVFAKRELR